jgi:ubiquinone/menaquinone biosynthesis C-methylase UbiE
LADLSSSGQLAMSDLRRSVQPMTATNAKEAVRRAYDQIACLFGSAEQGEGKHGTWVAAMLRQLEPGSAVLDLGCGSGVPVSRALADAGYAVTGVDFSEGQIGLARSLVPAALFRCADMTELELSEGMFEAVVSIYALNHVPRAELAPLLGRISRWLKPGGRLVVTLGRWELTEIDDDWLGDEAPMWWHEEDVATYWSWLEQAGLIVESEEAVREGDVGYVLFSARRA